MDEKTTRWMVDKLNEMSETEEGIETIEMLTKYFERFISKPKCKYCNDTGRRFASPTYHRIVKCKYCKPQNHNYV